MAAGLRRQGFTLVELLIVMGLVGILLSLTVANIIRPQNTASLAAAVDNLVADIKSQQLKTMSGDSMSATTAQQHGLRFTTNGYTLFKGAAYSAGDTDNLAVTFENGVNLATTLPVVSGASQLLFDKGDGDVTSFNASANVITLTNVNTGETKTITVNRYGALTVN